MQSASIVSQHQWFMGSEVTWLHRGEGTDCPYDIAIFAGPPTAIPPPHSHSREDEVFLFLEGECEVETAGGFGYPECKPGTIVFLPKDRAHGFRCLDEKLRVLVIALPGGLAGFFDKLSTAREDGDIWDPSTAPTPGQFNNAASQYGLTMLDRKTHVVGVPAANASLEPAISRPGTGNSFELVGMKFRECITTCQTSGAFSISEITMSQGIGTPSHEFSRHGEGIYVMEGEIQLSFGDKQTTLGAGSFHHVPRGTRFSFANLAAKEAQVFIINTPGGFDACLREAAATPQDLPAIAARYGVKL